MSIAPAIARRRAVWLVVGLIVVGLAAPGLASSRVDPAPTTLAALNDTTPPTTTITGGQSNPRSATFVLGASEPTSSFECDLDGAGFATCPSPYTVDHLSYGAHTIRARAIDVAGNVDPNPASESFSIPHPAPVAVRDAWGSVVYAPESLAITSAGTTALSIAWSAVGRAADAMSYRVSRNGVLIETDTNLSATMTGLGCGRTYTISVAAQDASGHVSAPASIMASTVQCRTPAVPVTVSIPQSIGAGSVLSATANGSIRTVSFGYCPGTTCTWATSTPIGSISGPGQADVWWSSPPPDGTYTVVVRAEDSTGATGDANPAIVTVDSSTPDTAIASGPNGFSPSTAVFNLAASESAARYECNLDGSGFFPCLQTFSPSGLAAGSHSLAVRAVDLAGNVDPTPVTQTWTLDADPPHTTLLAGQDATTPVATATFTLGSSEPGTFECKLDNAGTFTPCPSSLSFTGFSAGLHKLTARAVDLAGNVDPTPVVANWTSTSPTTPPETTITSAPASLVNTRGVLVFFVSDNPFAAFQCSVDGGLFVACLNPRPINNLGDGPHTFQVRATIGGLTDPTPATTSFTVDATAPTVTITPSRPADGAGWYRSSVSFTTTGVDAGGAVTCSAPQTYDGPDVSHLSIVGSCTDTAGNTRTKTFDLRYDTTAPSVRVAFRVRDRNGWYNRPFNVTWLGTDTGSGGVNCGPVQHYAGPDTPSGTLNGTCTDAAGNSASLSFPFAYDDTDPTVTATPSRTPDVDSWYNAPLSVGFDGTDAMSGGVTCDPPVDYAGPDSGTASVTGTCADAAGNVVPATFSFAYDATAPTVTATTGRAPDHNGWYNAPLAVTFAGTDDTSGGVSCDPARLYAGPDAAAVSIAGTCSDAAGNYASGSVDVAYDATGPSVTVAPDRAPDHNGWYNSAVSFATSGSDAVSGLGSCSPPVQYSAPDTATGSAAGSCTDLAGNTSSRSAPFKYDATAPTANATASRIPDSNGWYNAPFSVSYGGSDATSGPVSCSPAATYSGPDNATGSLSGSCSDQAGNTAPASYAFEYDATAPTVTATAARAADSNGWYNHPVSVSFSGSDALSNGVVCSADKTLATDSASALLAGTCTDAAGNTGTGTIGLSYDATAPAVTAGADRAPNANGWYRSAVGVSFAGTDALSGIAACDPAATYSGPDTAATTVSGSCTDRAGNRGNGNLAVHYDATAPTVSAALDRLPDSGSWYNHAVSATFSGTDATSGGVACETAKTYSAPDSATATLTGSCTDAAGNTGSTTKTFGYDATGPSVTVAAGRVPDHNGWYNSAVSFTTTGSDAASGLGSCSLPVQYFAPDTATGSISGSCTDVAGNTTTRAASFKYDATAPTASATASRIPDSNGWYNAAFSVNYAGTDATSGPVTCAPAASYTGPDTAAGSVSGSCSDQAGNTAPASYAFKYDATAPTVTPVAARAADSNGWYNHPVSVSFTGSDALSNGVVCSADQTLATDSASALLAGTCTDAAGNTGTGTIGLSYDATAPTVNATAGRAPNANGWYRSAVGISFAGTDALSGIGSCDPAASYSGPDTAATTVSGSCTDLAGNRGSGGLAVHYDATAPTAAAALDRLPDSGTWYNHAVSATFTGTDATSGGVACDASKTYSAPDSASASLTGSCTDAAGNTGSATKTFAYDATAPTVAVNANRPPDANGRYRSSVTFSFAGTDATSGGVTCDADKTYAGPDSVSALISGSCTDVAGNQGSGSTTIVYDSTPPETALLSAPPTVTNATTTQFAFSATEDGTFTCTVDGVAAACTSPLTVSGLKDGAHTFSVAATDLAGNVDATPATYSWTVDTVPPDTAFDTAALLDPTNGAQSFTITSEAGATFECSLDGAAFAACTSPASVNPPTGQHTFQARAIDAAGNVDPTPASFTWTEDKVAPTVTLTATPPALASSTSATFSWTTDKTAAYTCRVDLNAFASCGSGTSATKAFNGLAQGSHTFNLRARDAAGNLTNASYTWSIDTGPPDTILDTVNVPANPTASATASFSFTATEAGSTFKCQLDTGVFVDCTSPKTYTGLSDGNHTFNVEAIDAAGNVDPTPATFSWLVDITNPSGSITAPTAGATVSGTTPVTASATDNVSVLNVQFKLDGADLGTPVTSAPYTVNWDTTVTSDGTHTLTAVVKDEVSNTTTTAAVTVTVNNSVHPIATQSPDLVDVGPGSVDATTRNVIRTAAGNVYLIANDDTAAVNNANHPATGPGVIRAWKGNQAGTPTAFTEVDGANRPTETGKLAFGGVDVRLGSDGIAHTVYDDQNFVGTGLASGNLLYRTFSTVTDTWGAPELIASSVGTMDRGRIRFAMALDANNVPHVVWVSGCANSSTCTTGTLKYSNRIGGTWSAPVTIATGSPVHPMLAFDTTGVLHLTWLEEPGTGSSVRYASRTGTTWSAAETLPTGAILSNANADQGPSIATDSAGHPYVMYVGPSLGTFAPSNQIYGAVKAMEKIGASWTDVSPPSSTSPPQYLTHTPQVYLTGNDLYAFSGHDTGINFAYGKKLAGGSWSAEQKLTSIVADGSASIRWDPLHETDASIIDASTFNEDRLGNRSFLGEVYYMAVKPSVADTVAPTVALTAPAAGTVSGTVTVSANASDNVGVAGVTFKVDGTAIAAEDTTSPYSVSWDTTTATNGTHTITAVARDTAGNTTTSTSVTVTVSNAAPIPSAVGTLLFGATTALTPTDTNLPGQIEAFDVGTVTTGSVARMHVFLDAPLPTTLLVGLYSNNAAAGTPATLLSGTTISAPVSGWNDIAFGPVALTTGTKYWVAILAPTSSTNGPHFRDAKAGTGAGVFVASPAISALPTTWPAGGSKNTDGPMSAYGTTS